MESVLALRPFRQRVKHLQRERDGKVLAPQVGLAAKWVLDPAPHVHCRPNASRPSPVIVHQDAGRASTDAPANANRERKRGGSGGSGSGGDAPPPRLCRVTKKDKTLQRRDTYRIMTNEMTFILLSAARCQFSAFFSTTDKDLTSRTIQRPRRLLGVSGCTFIHS